jgi:hypothetical protein
VKETIMTHWHVQTHTEDDDVYGTVSVVSALDYAADALDRITDSEHNAITAYGESGDFEQAYVSFTWCESWSSLVANLRNVITQTNADASTRAPCYQDEPQYGLLWQRARTHVLETLHNEGPAGFALWRCERTECAPGEWVVSCTAFEGTAEYPRDEYPHAWSRLVTEMRDWADRQDETTLIDGPVYKTIKDTVLAQYGGFQGPTPEPADRTFEITTPEGTSVTFALTWVPETSED